MSKPVVIPAGYTPEWAFHAAAGTPAGLGPVIWFSVSLGSASMGLHLTAAQALDLETLLAAARVELRIRNES